MKVVRIDSEEEWCAGHELHVVPPLAENEPAGCPLRIPAAFPHARTHEVVGVLLVLLKDRRVVSSLSLEEELQSEIDEQISYRVKMF